MKSLLLASLALALLGILATWLLRRFGIQSPILHRITWGLVLAQGIVLIGIPLQLPIKAPDITPKTNTTNNAIEIVVNNPTPNTPQQKITDLPQPKKIGNQSSPLSTGNLLLSIYLCGIAAVTGFFAISYLALLWTARRSSNAPIDWQQQWQQLLNERGLANVPLRVHQNLGPMLCRLPKGYCLIIPREPWKNLSPEQREAVLEHEIGHIERRDIWKSLAARSVAMLHWFNPMAWWSVRQFEEAAEWDCDRRLASKGKRHAVEFAKALLQFAEPKSLPLGASLARGAALSPRIERLTNHGTIEKTGKRFAFSLLIASLAICALVRIELVAEEDDDEADELEMTSEVFNNRVDSFSKKITGSGETLESFRKMMASPAGRIVIKDRAEGAAEEAMDERMRNLLTDYIDKHFTTSATGKLQLKPESVEHRNRIIELEQSIESDLQPLDKAMAEVSDYLLPDSEAEQLLIRITKQEGAAALIYQEEISQQMRPTMQMMTNRLSVILSDAGDGRLIIPPSRTKKAEEIVRAGKMIEALTEDLRTEFEIFSADIATSDEFAKQIKTMMQNPDFPLFVAAVSVEDAIREKFTPTVGEIFENIEGGFIDRADGLHPDPKEKDEIRELMEHFSIVNAALPAVAEPLKIISTRIDTSTELSKDLSKLMQGQSLAMFAALDMEVAGTDAGEIFEDMIGEALVSKGKKKVIRKDAREDVSEHLRETLRDLRDASRRGRQFDKVAEKLDDAELSKVYQTRGGKLAVAQTIREDLESQNIDGFAIWISHHFTETDTGALTLKANVSDELEEMIEEAKEIEASLQSDF